MLARLCVAGVFAVHLGSCSGTGPTTPTPLPPIGSPPTPPTAGIQLVCQPSLLVGEASYCSASFTRATGQVTLIPPTADWSVTPADVAKMELSRVTGLAAGTATVRLSYEGQSATTDIAVKAEDGLVLSIATTQSSGIAREQATIDFFGYYSVVSADSGTIELVIRAADGRHISTARKDVTRGGGQFLLQNHITLPPGAGKVCGEAFLRIAGRSVEPTGPVANTPVCVTVTG
jgi:hypothetical protein